MKKSVFLIIFITIMQQSVAQRTQIIAYIDVDYILDNIPAYVNAQNSLDAKATTWKADLLKLQRHIEILKTDLANEKAILTADIIKEKEEDIALKQEEYNRLESLYFGPEGTLFNLRKQLVKPIQDQIYNAVQDIAKKKKFDFVFNKSDALTMLYFNKKYDISELVLGTLVKARKIKENQEKLNSKLQEKKQKIEAARKARLAKINEQKKLIKAKREAQLKERAAKLKALKQKKEQLKKEKENERLKKKNNN